MTLEHDVVNPMNARGLLMAHEEDHVRPVASDFDCFLLGSRHVRYEPLPAEQVALVEKMLDKIERVLDVPKPVGWMSSWLELVLADREPQPPTPQFGFGDPTSYGIISEAVRATHLTGAVRHGAECFNFTMPQDLDDEFLVCYEGFRGAPTYSKVPWRYVDRAGLLNFLSARVNEGFAFPINPKWALCDAGWYALFEKLNASAGAKACTGWYPPAVRKRMTAIHAKHPHGLQPDVPAGVAAHTMEADEAEWLIRRQ